MLPKFYIVKDVKDLLSGKIIPRKVLNYMPFGFGTSAMSPVMLPKPIKTATELTISPSSPFNLSPVAYGTTSLLPAPIKYAPSLTISESSPFLSVGPGVISSTSPFGSVEYRREPLFKSCASSDSLLLGPPIIRTSNMISQNIPGTLKVTAGTNTYSITVPANYLRSIANEISRQSAIATADGPLAQFRLITPSIDWTTNVSTKKVFKIIDSFNRNYPGLVFKLNDKDIVYTDLYNHLKTIYGYIF